MKCAPPKLDTIAMCIDCRFEQRQLGANTKQGRASIQQVDKSRPSRQLCHPDRKRKLTNRGTWTGPPCPSANRHVSILRTTGATKPEMMVGHRDGDGQGTQGTACKRTRACSMRPPLYCFSVCCFAGLTCVRTLGRSPVASVAAATTQTKESAQTARRLEKVRQPSLRPAGPAQAVMGRLLLQRLPPCLVTSKKKPFRA